MNLNYKIGLRVIKTVVAVFVCLILTFFLGRDSDCSFFASVGAIICLQRDKVKSFDTGFHRLLGTIIGGAFGYISLEVVRIFVKNENTERLVYIFLIPLFVLILIYFFNLLNHKSSAQISCIVLISLLLGAKTRDNAFWYVLNRVLDTGLGVVVAVLVNTFVFSRKSGENNSFLRKSVTGIIKGESDDETKES